MSVLPVMNDKIKYCENEGDNTIVYSYENISAQEADCYISLMIHEGYRIFKEYWISADNKCIQLCKKNDAVFVVYYSCIKEMRVVYEPDSIFLQFKDLPRDDICCSTLTGIDLEDYGMSYVIRLCDGRFIIIDGGWDFEADADKLMNCLREQSPYKIPVIASWIITHPDIDHYRCFIAFMVKYSKDVKIEHFIYNFPDYKKDNIKKVPALLNYDDISKLPVFEFWVKESGAKVYRAHTGQKYTLSNAEIEILSSPDDTYITPITAFNDISLVFKMKICNQTILWCGDADFQKACLAERWGEYLKSDILQIPHHGFGGGRNKEYDFINPQVCILPANENEEFKTDNIHRPQNRYLLCELSVNELFIGGTGQYVLKLPYTPDFRKKNDILNKFNLQK